MNKNMDQIISYIKYSDNRFMISEKCNNCYGNGKIYMFGDYRYCNKCQGSGIFVYISSVEPKNIKKLIN